MSKYGLDNFYKKFKLKYFWIFLTERCNLNCTYCFYKYKDNSTTLAINNLREIMNSAPLQKDSEVVISGGEPLIEWHLVEGIIRKIRQEKKDIYILLQTNGLLLDKEKAAILKKYNVNVEMGLDGDFCSNSIGREGTTREKYSRILKSIELLKQNKISFSCTMTVQPSQAKKMLDNCIFLLGKGFETIEITPAAFVPWNNKEAALFKKEYLKCLKYCISNKARSRLSAEYDKNIRASADAVITARGDVLPNWALLSLPPKKKEEYSLFQARNGKIKLNEKRIEFYDNLLAKFFSEGRTYREYSTLNAGLVYRELGIKGFDGYKKINDFLKKVNRKYIRS